MKIGVISDTHLLQPDQALTELMSGLFQEAEVILHAGDITEFGVLESFSGKKILAVWGNMDSMALRTDCSKADGSCGAADLAKSSWPVLA